MITVPGWTNCEYCEAPLPPGVEHSDHVHAPVTVDQHELERVIKRVIGRYRFTDQGRAGWFRNVFTGDHCRMPS